MSDRNPLIEEREPDDQEGTQTSQESEPETPAVDERGVPWFNRYKEAERKARKWEERYAERDRTVQEVQSNFRQQMEQWRSQQNTSTPKPTGTTPANSSQSSLNPDAIRDVIREEMRNAQTTSKWETAKDQAFNKALDRYSDLKDTESEFHREVYYETERRIKEYESMGMTPPPTTILDVANDVAASGGVTPRYSEDARPSVEKSSAPPPQRKRQSNAGDEVDVPDRMMALAKRAGISPEAMAKRMKTDPYARQALDMLKGDD